MKVKPLEMLHAVKLEVNIFRGKILSSSDYNLQFHKLDGLLSFPKSFHGEMTLGIHCSWPTDQSLHVSQFNLVKYADNDFSVPRHLP